jgi:hypothetical protein
MSGFLKRHDAVISLPPEWDGLATAAWQRRWFLAHAEATNPCAQRYYTWTEGGACVAGAIVYELPIDLLTYFPVRLPISVAPRLRVCGVPASVSCPGLLGTPGRAARLLAELCVVEDGLFVALNLPPRLPVPDVMSAGPTLPTVAMELPWRSLPEYEAALRADYRRRFRRIRARFADCRVDTTACDAYSTAHHAQYLAVLAKSEAKLETLPEAFFRALPADAFELTSVERDGRLLGWVILLERDQDAAFFMGGMPEDAAREPDLYFFLTSCVLERALARSARRLDFGQTAEVPKLRLGGRLEPRLMAVHHPLAAVRLLLAAAAPLLTYHRPVDDHHVFSAPAPESGDRERPGAPS